MSDLLNQASLVMVPSGYKEDTVYSVVPSDGSGDLSFTRASNGTRVNSAGLVEVTPWNFVAQSESIGTSPWLLNGATLTSGQTDPSGGTTAVKVELASGGNNYVYQGITLPNPINIVSAYLRADSATTIGFSIGGATPNAVNLTTTWQLFTFSSADTSGGIIFDNYFGPSPTQQAKTFYIWHPQLNIGSTAKPYFPTTDRLNVPRLTYQNGGGGGPSLLLEKQSTNYVLSSQNLTTYWNLSNTTATANSTTSPDGTQNASKLEDDSVNTQHRYFQNVLNSLTNETLSFSIYAKQGTHRYISWGITDNTDYRGQVVVDLQTGTITDQFTTNATLSNLSVASQGNGWYKISGTIAVSVNYAGGSAYAFGLMLNSSSWSTVGYTGTGTFCYLWGGQAELSSYPTSYIPTTSSSATRVADGPLNLSTTQALTNFTLFWDGLIFENGNNMFFGSGSSAWYIDIDGSTNRVVLDLSSGRIYSGFNAGVTTNQRFKLAIKRSAGVVDAFVNGIKLTPVVQVTDTTSLTLSSITWGFSSTYYPKMKVNEICAFQSALSDAECQSLTTL